MAYNDDAVLARLSALNESHDSIATAAQWIMFHRYDTLASNFLCLVFCVLIYLFVCLFDLLYLVILFCLFCTWVTTLIRPSHSGDTQTELSRYGFRN